MPPLSFLLWVKTGTVIVVHRGRGGLVPLREFKSFYKTVEGAEGEHCKYPTRLDTYGCGCAHDCSYCYAKSLLNFRGLWDSNDPAVADINDIRKTLDKVPPGATLRLGGMTDCFQPAELKHRVTYQTIKELNRRNIGYLIVTKSHHAADDEYLQLYRKDLCHIQITVTTLDDKLCSTYEHASPPTLRVQAIKKLQDKGFDVAIRLSPLIEDYMDFDKLNSLGIKKAVIEFLRVNSWIRQWFDIDYSAYKLKQGSYRFLRLADKKRLVEKVQIPTKTICEDYSPHYKYWQVNVNPNREDCCNLEKIDDYRVRV